MGNELAQPERRSPRLSRWAPACLISFLIAAALPSAAYWWVFVRGAITPNEAKALLARGAVLVDVMSGDEYAENHVQGAVNWPYKEIASLKDLEGVPPALRGRQLVLICPAGQTTALAESKLHDRGLTDTRHICAGVQAWIADAETPFREASPHEQWAAVIAEFAIAPLCAAAALLLVLLLRRRRTIPATLTWAMLAFLAGELAAAANALLFARQSYLAEHVHDLAALTCFGLLAFAALQRFFPDARRRRGVLLLLVAVAAVLAAAPLAASLKLTAYNTSVFGHSRTYTHAAMHQLFESRYCPVFAWVLLGGAMAAGLFCRKRPVPLTRVLLAAAVGPLGLALQRLLTFTPHADNQVWFVFAEAAAGLIPIVAAVGLAWAGTRRQAPTDFS